jgi:hypothetical protein
MPTMHDAIRAFRALRDQKKEMAERHKQEIAPLNEKMKKLESWMLRELDRDGADHVGTAEGTAYRTTRTSVTVEDWDAALTEIRDHQLWHLLERRLSKDGVQQYMEAEGRAFPGAKVTTEIGVNVRAS